MSVIARNYEIVEGDAAIPVKSGVRALEQAHLSTSKATEDEMADKDLKSQKTSIAIIVNGIVL